ncbi:MAG: iron chelate uptake ABC transporter family permease subunit [Pseudohongiellaceae bacterium]
MADFILYALLAGLAFALVAGPLGCFVVWRRMSFFGDTLAHSALLGIALGLLFSINPQLTVLASCLLFAVILMVLERKKTISVDALLGILAHTTLAVGVVLLAVFSDVQINIEAYLFGDLLTIRLTDLGWVVAVSALVGVVLVMFWNRFLFITVHEELASVEGVNVQRLKYLLVILMALLVAVAMNIVGVLLITSLLIIPPAASRQFARTPEQMAIGASGLGGLSVACGLVAAFYLDTPVGPSIVVIAGMFFFLIYLVPRRRRL